MAKPENSNEVQNTEEIKKSKEENPESGKKSKKAKKKAQKAKKAKKANKEQDADTPKKGKKGQKAKKEDKEKKAKKRAKKKARRMGQPEYAIRVNHVSMKFNLSKEKVDTLKEYVIKMFKHQLRYNEFWALQDINFELEKGDRLGILGLNGAGKSTLLKVIAGVYNPTQGTVERNGKIAPLLELGAGFDKDYTGAENIYLNGAVLGYSREFVDKKFDKIVKFSELGEFIDVPIKNYSSGMKSRLGFSIATAVNPDILILDEVLAVGDKKFRKKSEEKVMKLFDKGVTVLFVSHSLEQVKRLCNKAMILDHGKQIAFGDIDEVAAIYDEMTR
jgi:ABC-2 type transport system ATP-binding protein